MAFQPMLTRAGPRLTRAPMVRTMATAVHHAPRITIMQRLGPPVVTVTAVGAVCFYIYSQLHDRSSTFDQMFAQQNTPDVEDARRRDLHIADPKKDPRKTWLNILSW